MARKYQIFLSSTFTDLQDERKAITEAVLDLDHIPSGMELFPAADDEQFDYISRVIDDSDYYVLVIGGRYGSTTPDGLSFTEKEYDYAVSKNKVVLAFVHKNIDDLPLYKTEKDPAAQAALTAFKERVTKGRIVKFWSDKSELRQQVTTALARAFHAYPRDGWVRGADAPPVETLAKLQKALAENEELKTTIAELQREPAFEGLAGLDDVYSISFVGTRDLDDYKTSKKMKWSSILEVVGSSLIAPADRSVVISALESHIEEEAEWDRVNITRGCEDRILIQLEALRLIESSQVKTTKGIAATVQLTRQGKETLMNLMVVRK